MYLRNIILLLSLISILSCKFTNQTNKKDSIEQWIVSNREDLNQAMDSLILDYKKRNATDSNWISTSIAITAAGSRIFGALIEMISDSTQCFVVELTFYSDPLQKRKALIAAVDSTCLHQLKELPLKIDSTEKFIFGKNTELLN